ncbi:MAG: hypothetical protein IJI61_03510 [Oscillospiraceae bacterium]|nr:hypothetical protein [Oscillospiraceae bacterium]
MMRYRIVCALSLLTISLFLTGCGKKKDTGLHYEVIDGKIVEITQTDDGVIHIPAAAPGEASADTGVELSDGQAYVEEAYNSLTGNDAMMTLLQARLTTACDACREVYLKADKGTAWNVTLSYQSVEEMLIAIGNAGYPARDSNGEHNMRAYAVLDAFGNDAVLRTDDVNGSYINIYPDGHLSAFMLSRESGRWHLYSTSAAWNDDGSIRFYSAGRYAVGSVRYTSKGWLIYTRDTSDFDENQRANTDAYVMVRVLPMDAEAKALCQRYIEPIGYLENNLFITNWTEPNFAPIDFNSLYAYIFGMYNGTDMLSSYNVRQYYRAVGGTKLYLIPQDIFENNVSSYFRIDKTALRNASDYSRSLGGYFFLGYDRDYYNVTPRTPKPEVVSYTYNSDGSITMVVDAVNAWYGTDRAFRHELTVMPGEGSSFRYISNRLTEGTGNIMPAQKLSEMLNVEVTKLAERFK